MNILAVDPGSQRIGWAVMSDASTIVDAGLIEASSKKGAEPLDRVDDIAGKLLERAKAVMEKHGVTLAVMEVTSAKIHGKDRNGKPRGRMVGLQTLGAAVQACRMTLRGAGLEVHIVKENVWTRGVSKLDKNGRLGRVSGIALLFPKIDWSFDIGGDVRDAVGLGRYWFDLAPDRHDRNRP